MTEHKRQTQKGINQVHCYKSLAFSASAKSTNLDWNLINKCTL